MKKTLFDHKYDREWPDQQKFPINEDTQGRIVHEVLLKDIEDSEEFIIITGFTSLSNIVRTFGLRDFPKLKNTKIVIGFEPDDRVSKRLPHYSLTSEIKNYWLKRNVSILNCGPILNVIEKINKKEIEFKAIDKLHAKIYVGDRTAILGSSNFSISGTLKQREANIRVTNVGNETELFQYNSIKQIADNYFDLGTDYTEGIIDLLHRLLKDANWQEALARAIAEILESKWMNDYPILYNAIVSNELWPTQKIGIARAMKIIQDQGNLLIADPTGSGKTKFATALAYTIFHWLWENGLRDKSNALIISPRQVMENWEREQKHFRLFNKIESMGSLSIGSEKNKKALVRDINSSDILIIDEAHNYLRRGSDRSKAIAPKGSSHVILATATPINKKAEDLLRLIELLDIDNLSDDDLDAYQQLRKNRNSKTDIEHLNKLKGYINQFIVRRTKKELNRMIDREPAFYKNSNGNLCRYPETKVLTYHTNETDRDRQIASEITTLVLQLKGVNYLQKLTFPEYLKKEEEKIKYLNQRFNSGPALAAFEVKSSLRSSKCALYEYIYGTSAANEKFDINSIKSKTGNIISKLARFRLELPKTRFPREWLTESNRWVTDLDSYQAICDKETEIYEKIGNLCVELSDNRELAKAKLLIETANLCIKVIGFDSTVITLDYLKKLIIDQKSDALIIVAAGHTEANKAKVREFFNNANSQSSQKLIALCSDAMSESINLPAGKAVILLDMPSVLRIIEQRIGRLERMDSEHKEIFVYWPEDAEEFSLKGDKRIIEILVMAEHMIGSNVDVPRGGIYEKYLKEGIDTTERMMKAYKEFVENEGDWEGVKDSTQSIYGLMDGKNALITEKIYNEFKDVDVTVKTAISFVETDEAWSFFAFRGDSKRSPKWLFIDVNGEAITDFSQICDKLQLRLKDKNITQRRWDEVDTAEEVKKIVYKLRKQEKNLLPWKKRRALDTGKRILTGLYKSSKELSMKELIRKLLNIFDDSIVEENMIDYNHFADLWLTLLLPALDEKRKNQVRQRTIITLKNIEVKDVKLDYEQLTWIYENCQYSNTLDEMIASCIIAVKQ